MAVEGQVLCILRTKLIEFAHLLDVCFERKRCVKDEYKNFGLSSTLEEQNYHQLNWGTCLDGNTRGLGLGMLPLSVTFWKY